MREFMVRFHSLRDVQEFVDLCSRQTFQIKVGNDRHQVNATHFMGLFSLNCSKPQMVMMDCTEDQYLQFRQEAGKFLADE